MTEIIKGRVRWYEGYANNPELELLIDRDPPHEEFRFQHRQGLWYAAKDGVVHFFSYEPPTDGRPMTEWPSHGGFGGSHFDLTMEDGSVVTLKGPWSSRASAMHFVGFPDTVEGSVTDDPAVLDRGYTFHHGAVTLELLERFIDRIEVTPFKTKSEGLGWGQFDGQIDFPVGSRIEMRRFELDQHHRPFEAAAEQIGHDVFEADGTRHIPSGEFLYLPTVRLPDGTIWKKPKG